MESPEKGGFTPEQTTLAEEISKRASAASEKIKQRVQEIIIPKINQVNSYSDRWLSGLQTELYILVDNPDDERVSGNYIGGNYKGWTEDELRELFSVLFGEEMD